MRLIKYLSYSGLDDKTNIFRALSIKLVDAPMTANREIVSEVVDRYKLDEELLTIIDDLNKQLKKTYKGKLKFDFCLEEGSEISKVKTKRAERLKLKAFEASRFLSKQQFHLEKKLSDEMNK
jgi:hypothetical protein